MGTVLCLMAFLCSVSTVCVPLHENVLCGVHKFSLIPNFCVRFFIFIVSISYRRVTKRNYHSSLLLSILLSGSLKCITSYIMKNTYIFSNFHPLNCNLYLLGRVLFCKRLTSSEINLCLLLLFLGRRLCTRS